jgi:hypothetical protein
LKVLGIRFNNEDGSITVEWYRDSEQKEQGGVFYSTLITTEAMEDWEHVGYYAKEIAQDAEELVDWFNKYREGRVG